MISIITNVIPILCLLQISELYYFTSQENSVNEEFKKADVQDKVQNTMFGALIIFILLFFSGRNPFGLQIWNIDFTSEKGPGIMEVLLFVIMLMYLWNYSKIIIPEAKGLLKMRKQRKTDSKDAA